MRKEKRTMEVKKKSTPILPWMRNPIDVNQFEACALNLVPCLDPRLEVLSFFTLKFNLVSQFYFDIESFLKADNFDHRFLSS